MVEDILKDGMKLTDDLIESKGELRELAIQAHTADMLSDNKLSKLVRPIIALTLLGLKVIEVIASLWEYVVPEHISYGLDGMLAAAIAFYFGGKSWEKVAEKKALTEIRVKSDLAKAAIEKEKVLLKEEVRDNKEERKAERKANRRPLFGRKNPRR